MFSFLSVFTYGRGTENRTLINRLKAYYFAVKLYPRHLITLVTCHDRSPFKNFGAGEEIRTLDIYLGKVMLYQLSYARIVWYSEGESNPSFRLERAAS